MPKIESLCTLLPLLGATLAACGGGAAATGGAAPPSAKPADSAVSAPGSAKACPDNAIDDAEDNDGKVLAVKDRAGYWFTYADDNGSTISPFKKFEMATGGANGSKYSAHMTGKMSTKGDSVWAGMGFNFGDPKKPYNATAYKGISFQAKIGPGSTDKMRVTLADANTDPDGKVCKACYNHFGADVTLTDKWAKYTILFSGMAQQSGWGDPHPPSIDASKVYGVQWAESTAGASFDVWIDDVQFVCE
jgi:hypothetical protein